MIVPQRLLIPAMLALRDSLAREQARLTRRARSSVRRVYILQRQKTRAGSIYREEMLSLTLGSVSNCTVERLFVDGASLHGIDRQCAENQGCRHSTCEGWVFRVNTRQR